MICRVTKPHVCDTCASFVPWTASTCPFRFIPVFIIIILFARSPPVLSLFMKACVCLLDDHAFFCYAAGLINSSSQKQSPQMWHRLSLVHGPSPRALCVHRLLRPPNRTNQINQFSVNSYCHIGGCLRRPCSLHKYRHLASHFLSSYFYFIFYNFMLDPTIIFFEA